MTSVEKTVDTLVQSFQAFREENAAELKSMKGQMVDSSKPHLTRPAKSNQTGGSMENCEYKTAFQTYVRTGNEAALRNIEAKSLSTLSGDDGGYTIPQTLMNQLDRNLGDISVIRRMASVMSVSSSSVDLLLNTDDAAVGWSGENDVRGDTTTPKLRKLSVAVHEMYAKPRATQKLLDDSAINVEKWLSDSIAHRLCAVENHAFLFGDGHNKPTGILSYETGDEATWGTFKHVEFDEDNIIDNLIDMFAGIKGKYLDGACWLLSRSTLAHLRKLKDQDGRHIWQPSLDAKTPSLLLGYPVELCDDMPALGSEESPSVIFGNFAQAYQIVDRQGVSVLRDPYSAKPHVEFYTTKRVGGDVVNFEALTMLVASNNDENDL